MAIENFESNNLANSLDPAGVVDITLRQDLVYPVIDAEQIGRIPIKYGGTGANDREHAMRNLLVLANNHVPENDTPEAWVANGNNNSITYIINDSSGWFPTAYGVLLTMNAGTLDGNVTSFVQVWFRQGYGDIYYRAGNGTGWEGDANLSGKDAWIKVIDDKGGLIKSPITIETDAIYSLILRRLSDGNNSWIKFIDVDGDENGAITVATGSKIEVMDTANTDSSYTVFDERDIIPAQNGGLGFDATKAHNNAVICISGDAPAGAGLQHHRTNNGAFYATGQDTVPKFGILPIAQGGTGASSSSGVLKNLGITATAAEINKLSGADITVDELNLLDGATGNIQDQLNKKAASTHKHAAADITSGTVPISRGGTGGSTKDSARKNLGFEIMSFADYNALAQKDGTTLYFCYE